MRFYDMPDYKVFRSGSNCDFVDGFRVKKHQPYGRFDGIFFVVASVNEKRMNVWLYQANGWQIAHLTDRDPLVRAVLRRYGDVLRGSKFDVGSEEWLAGKKASFDRQVAQQSNALNCRSPRPFDVTNKNAGSIAHHASIREVNDLTVQYPRRPYAGIM
jgi:hypothetical protein